MYKLRDKARIVLFWNFWSYVSDYNLVQLVYYSVAMCSQARDESAGTANSSSDRMDMAMGD